MNTQSRYYSYHQERPHDHRVCLRPPPGPTGLACDDDGVALSPMRLVEALTDAGGCRRYRLCPAPDIAEALRLAYGSASNEIERCQLATALGGA